MPRRFCCNHSLVLLTSCEAFFNFPALLFSYPSVPLWSRGSAWAKSVFLSLPTATSATLAAHMCASGQRPPPNSDSSSLTGPAVYFCWCQIDVVLLTRCTPPLPSSSCCRRSAFRRCLDHLLFPAAGGRGAGSTVILCWRLNTDLFIFFEICLDKIRKYIFGKGVLSH